MSSDFFLGLQMIFNIGWTVLTSFKIPGTNVTPAAFLLFITVSGLSLKFIRSLFGVGRGSDISSVSRSFHNKP